MLLNRFRRILSFAGLLVAALALVSPVAEGQGVGFPGIFEDPPQVVSWYDGRPQVFSAANPPLSIEPFSPLLLRSPTLRWIASPYATKQAALRPLQRRSMRGG